MKQSDEQEREEKQQQQAGINQLLLVETCKRSHRLSIKLAHCICRWSTLLNYWVRLLNWLRGIRSSSTMPLVEARWFQSAAWRTSSSQYIYILCVCVFSDQSNKWTELAYTCHNRAKWLALVAFKLDSLDGFAFFTSKHAVNLALAHCIQPVCYSQPVGYNK